MSNRRVLSSRDASDNSKLTRLFELLYLLRDSLGEPHESFPDDEDALLDELGEAAVRLAISYEDEQDEVSRLTMEVLSHTMANTLLEMSVSRRQTALEVLSAPPAGYPIQFAEAMKFFLSASGIKTSLDVNGEMVYTMNADTLSEALQGGIEMYNLEHVSNMKL